MVHIMACLLIGTKPSYEVMLTYFQFGFKLKKNKSVKFDLKNPIRENICIEMS